MSLMSSVCEYHTHTHSLTALSFPPLDPRHTPDLAPTSRFLYLLRLNINSANEGHLTTSSVPKDLV